MDPLPLVLWLGDPGAAGNPLLGGKFGSLGTSVAEGLPVPPGFGITTHAYRSFLGESGLAAEAVAAAYAELGRRCGERDVPVAVRSSGEAEDLAGASFAGQYDTFLWVRGADAVLAHMRRCWAGLFGAAVLSYRPAGEAVAGGADVAICVGVQRMVDARTAGVMFTLNPLNGDRSKVMVEAVWGLGEGVVKGDVPPSRFCVDKVTREIGLREIVPQGEEYRFNTSTGAVGLFPVPPDREGRACLGDDELQRLVQLGRDIEKSRGGTPLDIEWAIGPDGAIAVLQVRPETVWSARARAPIKLAGPPIAHVLTRMSAPAVAMKPKT